MTVLCIEEADIPSEPFTWLNASARPSGEVTASQRDTRGVSQSRQDPREAPFFLTSNSGVYPTELTSCSPSTGGLHQ